MENTENTPENNLTIFNDWIKNLSENGKVGTIEPELVRGVLESCGANFEDLTEEQRKSLRGYSNYNKKMGLDAVWGVKREVFKKWVIGEYIPFAEKRAGREMHTLWDKKTETYDDIKYSGPMAFLGELTAFAAGEMPLKKYSFLTEDRVRKGKRWEYGDRYEPYKPSKHSAFPVDFPRKAIDRLMAVL